jgi:MoaA/NifB/PqqE/SkfB family radical SAM enzyme
VEGGKPQTLQSPLGMLAELTHRCPLGCPYCSNPLALDRREDELDIGTWTRVFREAAQLGILQVHLSGGEPAARHDLVAIAAACHDAGLYSNLITSAVGLTVERLRRWSRQASTTCKFRFRTAPPRRRLSASPKLIPEVGSAFDIV